MASVGKYAGVHLRWAMVPDSTPAMPGHTPVTEHLQPVLFAKAAHQEGKGTVGLVLDRGRIRCEQHRLT